MISPFWAIPFAFLFVATMIGARWIRTAVILRRTIVIPVKPTLVETHEDQMPSEMKQTLAQVVPALQRLGFTIAANMHAPELARLVTWTQVLFIHRERGDRASVMHLRAINPRMEGGHRPPSLGFATEAPDGRSVKTSLVDPVEVSVESLYQRHRCDVDAKLGPTVRGVVPEPGKEAQWLTERAGTIAQSIARQSFFALDRDGLHYRPTWRRALRMGWLLVWARREKQGFDVLPPAASSD